MNSKYNLKRLFLILVIGSLIFSAIIAILVFLAGKFGEVEARLLLTTLAIGGFSLTGMCSSALHDKLNVKIFSVIGVIISAIALLFTVYLIWGDPSPNGGNLLKLELTLIILAFSMAHSSMILLVRPNNGLVYASQYLTLASIALVASMLITLVFIASSMDEAFFRLLGVFAVLDILGTIVTPLLKKYGS